MVKLSSFDVKISKLNRDFRDKIKDYPPLELNDVEEKIANEVGEVGLGFHSLLPSWRVLELLVQDIVGQWENESTNLVERYLETIIETTKMALMIQNPNKAFNNKIARIIEKITSDALDKMSKNATKALENSIEAERNPYTINQDFLNKNDSFGTQTMAEDMHRFLISYLDTSEKIYRHGDYEFESIFDTAIDRKHSRRNKSNNR